MWVQVCISHIPKVCPRQRRMLHEITDKLSTAVTYKRSPVAKMRAFDNLHANIQFFFCNSVYYYLLNSFPVIKKIFSPTSKYLWISYLTDCFVYIRCNLDNNESYTILNFHLCSVTIGAQRKKNFFSVKSLFNANLDSSSFRSKLIF